MRNEKNEINTEKVTELFESEEFDEVLTLCKSYDFDGLSLDDKINVYQMLSISAEKTSEFRLAYETSARALDILVREDISDENEGLIKMFGRIGSKALMALGASLTAYKFIIKYKLRSDDVCDNIFANIYKLVHNKVFGSFGIIYLGFVLLYIFVGANIFGLDYLSSLLIDIFLIILTGLILIFRKKLTDEIIKII